MSSKVPSLKARAAAASLPLDPGYAEWDKKAHRSNSTRQMYQTIIWFVVLLVVVGAAVFVMLNPQIEMRSLLKRH
jgi:hypothetical protein